MIFPRKHSRNAGKSEVKFRSIIVSSKSDLAVHNNQTIINIKKEKFCVCASLLTSIKLIFVDFLAF